MLPLGMLVLMACAGVVAGAVGGVVGFGSAVILIPLCVAVFGPSATIGVMTVASLIGNLARVGLYWRDTRWEVVWRYWLGALPAAIVGAMLVVKLEARWLPALFGVFLVVSVPARKALERNQRKMQLGYFPALGAAVGFISATLSTAGPVNAPFYLAYGLTRGTYIATEALGAAGVHLTKSIAYGKLSFMTLQSLISGVGLGVCLWIGSLFSKQLVDRIDDKQFQAIVEVLLVATGVWMVVSVFLPVR